MASGRVFQTTVRLQLPVWVRRPIVKDDSLVEIVSQLRCEGKKEEGGWNKRGKKKVFHSLLCNWRFADVATTCGDYYGDRVSRLSFILALTIYAFHLLLFSNITPQVSITKEAAKAENRDVTYALWRRRQTSRAAGCLSSPPAASGKCLWSAGCSNPPSSFPHLR